MFGKKTSQMILRSLLLILLFTETFQSFQKQTKERILKDKWKKKKKMEDGRSRWVCKVKGGTTELVGFDNISDMKGK